MSTNLIKKSAVALAVAGALVAASSVSAATAKQYNLNNKKLIKPEVSVTMKQNAPIASSWLVKLKTASISQTSFANASNIEAAQNSVEIAIHAMGLNVTVLAKTSKLVNSIVIKGDKREIEKLLSHTEVEDIYPVYDYDLDVADSADYIKATPLVANGVANGEGVRVAVLDTGIDYTHAVFGGAGTLEAYSAAATDPTDEVSWPQGQVKGGWDFINNDPDPIDAGTSHGTHVSHSVTGIAPNVELFVYSVCNSGCPGLAQLLALEAAMDPNNDGNISDRVDVINMSLGGNYGDRATDAVGLMINEAVRLGTNLVISAGNSGPYPFVVGGPSTSENALSVGAMTHPVIPAAVVEGTFLGGDADVNASGFNPEPEFSFNNSVAPLVYPADNQVACDPFAGDVDFTGKAVIVDRGACDFTQKVINAQEKGALFVLIANDTPEAGATAPGGSNPAVAIPSVGISYELGMSLKDALAGEDEVVYSVTSELFDQEGAIASFTSRGPSMNGLLKPEITAPGISIMTAEPGTGTELAGATGTSFSGPITAGALSLLKEALPERNAFELKATLMNTASLNVTMQPRATHPDTTMAPISYIGAGLVDVEKASNLPVAAWAKDTKQAALSFGLVNIASTTEFTKTVQVKNFSNEAKTYTLSLEQRFTDDVERGALAMSYPESITVPAGQVFSFDVVATIDPAKLPEWTLHSGNVGSRDATNDLTTLELDGALNFLEDGEQAFHLVYHVLPKAVASVEITPTLIGDETVHILTNTGSVDFEPIFVERTASDAVDGALLDIVSVSLETVQISSETCASGYATFSTFVMNEGFIHTYIGGFMADFDVDQDGEWDVTVQNGKLEWFLDVEPGTAISFTHVYGSARGALLDHAYHTVGNNFVTLQSCLGNFGLEAKDLDNVTATVRFRTEEQTWTPVPFASLNEIVAEYTFSEAKPVAELVAATNVTAQNSFNELASSSTVVDVLKPGESAQINNTGADFVMLSTSGSKALNATPTSDSNVAPVITAAEFSVDENTANEVVIGQLEVTYPAEFANPVAEYIVLNSTSSAVNITASGSIVVTNSEQLDFEAGLTMVELEVVAVNTSGTVSDSEMIKVMVNNVADSAPDLTVTMVAETVAENNERTLVADLTAMINEADATLASFEVIEGDAFEIESSQLFLKAGQDFEAGAELMAKVVAKDSAELVSTAFDVKVTLTDIDETPPVVEPPKKKKSSGSLAWLMLLATPFAFLRRRKSQK